MAQRDAGARWRVAAPALVLVLATAVAEGLGPTLTASPGSVTGRSWIAVSFDGVPEAELQRQSEEFVCDQDTVCRDARLSLWVGMFPKGVDRAPIGPQPEWKAANPPWLATSPMKWKPLAVASGRADFFLDAMHDAALEFVLFSNGTTWPIELAVSNVVEVVDASSPKHVRLARSRSTSEMVVSWSAKVRDATAVVRWGAAPGSYTQSAAANLSTYSREAMCGPPATTHGFAQPPWFYSASVDLSGSAPRGAIYYVVGSDATGWSPEHSFQVPEAASSDATLRVVAMADIGESSLDGAQYHWMEPFAINTTAFAAEHLAGRGGSASLVLHIGDISYATGYASKWDAFLDQVEPLASRAPYMTAQGNHERDWPNSGSDMVGTDSGGECGVPMQARFPMPVHGSQDQGWYSFDQGPVHFVMMNTEMSAARGSPQWAFFDEDLAAVDRSRTPWVIFSGHRPMYSSAPLACGAGDCGHNLADGSWWRDVEALLLKYQVDLCLWGHVHNAELTCPLANGRCVEAPSPGAYDAPVHAVIGNGGQSLSRFCVGECCCSSVDPRCEVMCALVPRWSKWRMDRFGYSTIEAKGVSELTINFYADCLGEVRGLTMGTCTEFNKLMHSHTITRKRDAETELIF